MCVVCILWYCLCSIQGHYTQKRGRSRTPVARKRQRMDESGRATSSSRTPRDESGIRDPKVSLLILVPNEFIFVPNVLIFVLDVLIFVPNVLCLSPMCSSLSLMCCLISQWLSYLIKWSQCSLNLQNSLDIYFSLQLCHLRLGSKWIQSNQVL